MQGPDFVVPVGSDQQQVPDVGLGHQVFDQIQSGRIEPLQIVEEQRERMLRARKHADEAPEHELEAALRILRRQVGQRRGLADDELDFGHQVHDEPCVRSQRLLQRLAPSRQLRLALREQRPDQTLEGLRQRRIRDVALVLVELARGEQSARRHQRPVQLVDHRRLADARIARDEHQLRPAAADRALEGGEQGRDLARAPVEPFGNDQPVRRVALAERECVDAAAVPPKRRDTGADHARLPPAVW